MQDGVFLCIIRDMAVSPQEFERQQANGRVPNTDTLSPLPPPAQPEASFQIHGRYRRILLFFGRIILQIILWDLIVSRLPLIGDWVRGRRPLRMRKTSQKFRILALEMGGVMIKLGQFLSSRVDILPLEITDELKDLQDEVPPEPTWRIMAALQEAMPDYQKQFLRIEETPLAAASLGQAHRAWIRANNGDSLPVVIKVQRPYIEEIVRTDLNALRVVARWIMRYKPIRRRADVPALLAEFSRTLWEELDYELEADNAERFAELYANDNRVYIPSVYRPFSSERVIVLENVEAIKITDVAALTAVGIDPKQVAEVLLDSYFQQIFQEGFFHADPHPGNLFIRPRTDLPWPASQNGTAPELGRPFWLIFVDFGMIGRVPDAVGENLRKVLVSVLQKDGRQLTEAYAELGFFLPNADLERITEAQNAILERIWGRSLLELSKPDPAEVQELSSEFRDLLFEFPIQVPQDFIYLGRAIGMVSGIVSQLDEEINPWYYFEKYGETLIKEQQSTKATVETIWEVIRPYFSTPAQVQRLLNLAESGQLKVKTDRDTLKQYERIEKRISQLSWSILGAAGMLSATLLFLSRKQNKDDKK